MNLFVRSATIRKIMLMMVLVSNMFLVPTAFAATDTTWSVSFRLNMTKAVNDGIFMPDSDYVYLLMDNGMQPLMLVQGPGYTYTATLFDQLDSGITYYYRFRINSSLQETVVRSFIARPGMVDLSNWWNDQSINYTTFVVNMKYAVQFGWFNPASDSVCILGTMNNMLGSPKMTRIGASLDYSYVYSLDPGSVQQYKYRINLGDSALGQLELLYRPNRIIRIPDTLLEVSSDYDNFNPAKRLMTFQCDMGYYVKAHHFYEASDYLDVAGNFNGFGANDVLFDTEGDTIYSLQLFLDTAWIHKDSLAFKFRINGNWNTAELSGKPYRTYSFHDTINQNPNFFGCYYNNLDPSISTPPWVYNVEIQGLLIYKKFLSGSYAYENVNGIPEGISGYRWLRSNNAQGLDATVIDSALKITYIVDTLDIGKWLVFEVTPRAASGDSATGKPVRVVSATQVSAWDVGMDEYSTLPTHIYPNPVNDYFTVEAKREFQKVELFNSLNQTVLIKDEIGSTTVNLFIGGLPHGFYVVKVSTKTGQFGVARVIKY